MDCVAINFSGLSHDDLLKINAGEATWEDFCDILVGSFAIALSPIVGIVTGIGSSALATPAVGVAAGIAAGAGAAAWGTNKIGEAAERMNSSTSPSYGGSGGGGR